MACRSFACSRRSVSDSSFGHWTNSGVSVAKALRKFCRACPSAVCLISCVGRFPSTFRVVFRVSALGVIMFISSYEFVAYSVHSQKKPGLLRNWFEFLPDPHDMSIHRPSSREILVTPNFVKQPLAAQRLPGVT